MKKPAIYTVITIDTESDHSVDWHKSKPLKFESVADAIPKRLEPLFGRYGAIGTYLLSVEVLENKESMNIMRSFKGRCELGTHLHPEFIEPKKKYSEYGGILSSEFSTQYDPETERAKLESITRLFIEKVGYRPKVYRGGKFGFGDTTASSLMDLGYAVDTSVTPRISWANIGGQDFRKSGTQPYFIDFNDGRKPILEVPVSIGYVGIVDRLLQRPAWLRPSFSSEAKMRMLVDNLIRLHKSEDLVVLNLMFHNMEFCAGASPYAKDEKDCADLLRRLEGIIRYCRKIGGIFCSLSAIRELYDKKVAEKAV